MPKNNSDKGARTKRLNKIKDETKSKMMSLNLYKPEFDDAISRYADLVEEYRLAYEHWSSLGCPMISNVPTSQGEWVEKKNAHFAVIQELRKEISSTEILLGLNPKGLQAMKKKALESKKAGGLDAMLGGAGDGK